MNYQLNKDEKIQLLIGLLDENQIERSVVANNIHSQCSNAAALLRFIEIAERKLKENTLNQKALDTIRGIAKALHANLSDIQFSVFPTGSSYTGLADTLGKFINSCRDNFKTEIEFICVFNQDIEMETTREVAVYNICQELIEFVCIQKAQKTSVRLELIDGHLYIDISRLDKRKQSKLDSKQLVLLNRINAQLIWQNATLLPGTNNIDCFKLDFLA